MPPSPLVLVVIEADTTNLSKCPHNLASIKIHKYKFTKQINTKKGMMVELRTMISVWPTVVVT